MRAKDIMGKVKAPIKTAKVREIALKLLSDDHSSLPVVDTEGRVVGIISEFDILKAIRSGRKLDEITVDEVMSHSPLCIDAETPVDAIIDLMTEKHLLRVPVIKDGRLAGAISRRNILDSLVYHEFKESFWVLRD
ncbi:MAG: CBS domain-containing protein [Nitrospirota bacterium]